MSEAKELLNRIGSRKTNEQGEGLTLRDWKSALEAWEVGASNSSGLIHSLADVAPRIWNDVRQGGDRGTFNKHPIIRLYIAQLASLAGIGIGEEGGAADVAKEKIAELEGGEE